MLKKVDPCRVDVVGLCTSICVMDLLTDLRTQDYRVVVYRDALADFDRGAHKFALRHMKRVWGAESN